MYTSLLLHQASMKARTTAVLRTTVILILLFSFCVQNLHSIILQNLHLPNQRNFTVCKEWLHSTKVYKYLITHPHYKIPPNRAQVPSLASQEQPLFQACCHQSCLLLYCNPRHFCSSPLQTVCMDHSRCLPQDSSPWSSVRSLETQQFLTNCLIDQDVMLEFTSAFP